MNLNVLTTIHAVANCRLFDKYVIAIIIMCI